MMSLLNFHMGLLSSLILLQVVGKFNVCGEAKYVALLIPKYFMRFYT